MSPVPPYTPGSGEGGGLDEAAVQALIDDSIAAVPQTVPHAGTQANQAVNTNTQLADADGLVFVSASCEIYLPEDVVPGFSLIVQSNGLGGISSENPIVVKMLNEDRDVNGSATGVAIVTPFSGATFVFDGVEWYAIDGDVSSYTPPELISVDGFTSPYTVTVDPSVAGGTWDFAVIWGVPGNPQAWNVAPQDLEDAINQVFSDNEYAETATVTGTAGEEYVVTLSNDEGGFTVDGTNLTT